MDDESNFSDFPYKRGEFLTQINKFKSLRNFRSQYQVICKLINDSEDVMQSWGCPKNAREDFQHVHEKKSLRVWKRQKEHLEQRISMLEQQIEQDIKKFKYANQKLLKE